MENEALRAYHAPGRSQDASQGRTSGAPQGFVVRGAPWDPNSGAPGQVSPQTGNLEEFPTLAGMGNGNGLATSQANNSRWGAPR